MPLLYLFPISNSKFRFNIMKTYSSNHKSRSVVLCIRIKCFAQCWPSWKCLPNIGWWVFYWSINLCKINQRRKEILSKLFINTSTLRIVNIEIIKLIKRFLKIIIVSKPYFIYFRFECKLEIEISLCRWTSHHDNCWG